jgi:hypothetical protein
MAATVHWPLNVVAFHANDIGRQAFELRKQMPDVKKRCRLDIMNSDNLPIILWILDHIKARELMDPDEKFTDWKRFTASPLPYCPREWILIHV